MTIRFQVVKYAYIYVLCDRPPLTINETDFKYALVYNILGRSCLVPALL